MKQMVFTVLTCLSLISAGCGGNDVTKADKEVPVRPVRYIELDTGTQTLSQRFTGTAAADRQAILSFKVTGTITRIPVNLGDRVTTGTLLARLDETDFKVDLASARAGLKSAQADAKSAQTRVYTTRSNYDRVQKLYENDSVSLSEFEQARGDYETALAQLQAAQSKITMETSKLRAAENQLLYTRLFAPFDGIVNNLAVDENEEISPGSPVLTLSSLGKMEVKLDVSDRYIADIRAGMPCSITFPALAREALSGRVTEVSYGTTDKPTYPVTVAVLSEDARLRPGMAAEVRMDFSAAPEQTGLYMPPDGVGEEQGRPFVFVLEKGPDSRWTARKQIIALGPLTEAGFLVKTGLAPGDRVAVSGLQLLLDGMSVTLMDDAINDW
jgi:membrane fusion protein, multidrug efflux system